MNKYNPKEIEPKWQKKWEESGIYKTPENATKDSKMYILPQLPYPSGSGLHVGHAEVYTACDIYARYQRMVGKDVLQVFGLDSFGLPAENYAIKTNVHPAQTIDETGAHFVEQVKSLGVSVDWDRFVRSSDPGYYKWTQWFFLLMYERGLAYRKKQAVNWCESCKTVLANEQVVNGNCERCDTQVLQKEMDQWYLRITDYADRLDYDLDKVDWSEETVKRQRDWIGRSQGAQLSFDVAGSDEKIEVFTTRPDTLFGATYMVLAPEHGLVQSWKDKIENWDEVEAYIVATQKKSELDRQIDQEKTGVELKGIKAINPANGKEIPVWIADYVLATYGTGAIMAVPAHDERDFAFAKKFALPIEHVVAELVGERKDDFHPRRSVRGICIRDGKVLLEFDTKMQEYVLPGGGIEDGEDIKAALVRELAEECGYSAVVVQENLGSIEHNYFHHKRLNDWRVLESAYYIEIDTNQVIERPQEEVEKVEFDWYDFDEAIHLLSEKSPTFFRSKVFLERAKTGQEFCYVDAGVAIHSDFLDGLTTEQAKEKMIQWLEEKGIGKRKTQYKLRDWSVSRQRFWGAPIPMVIAEDQKSFTLPTHTVNLHAWGSGSQAQYHPWIDNMLENTGVVSVTPELPDTENPQFGDWLEAAIQALTEETSQTVVTGRSLGCWTALKLAEDHEFQKLILVAPTTPIDAWYKKVEDKLNMSLAKAFVADNVDLKKVSKNVGEIVVFLSLDDPYIPVEETKAYFEEHFDRVRVIVQRGAGHFDDEHGYATFPALLHEIVTPPYLNIRSLDVDDLPVILPNDVDFKPTGQSPLTYSESFQSGVEEKYGKGWKREVDTLDTFMCSSWYFFRYLDPHNDKAFASPEALKTWMPVDFYLGGAEHVNGHLLYSRFFTKVLFDAGYIDFDEPFITNRHQGLILGEDNRKMSKRWGNVINPTDVVNEYGADTCRTYEMFMGPLEDTKPWNTGGVKGVQRFLEKVWKLSEKVSNGADGSKMDGLVHKTLKKVGDDTATLQFNTAIAKMMELVNAFGKEDAISQQHFEMLLKMLAPYAPHITEELWEQLGHNDSITTQPWPVYDESKLVDDMITLVVQVNGKVRANMEVSADIDEETAKASALELPAVQKWLEGKEPKKVIFVKGKLVSVVV
ncbi:class I tRNA ligase family protein [Candidatus Nomurabacteria bacterium]|nr:class I tRNA ligase family protein [Candidatus Nomurabacteria bacterium]